jgi:hypothetical protein
MKQFTHIVLAFFIFTLFEFPLSARSQVKHRAFDGQTLQKALCSSFEMEYYVNQCQSFLTKKHIENGPGSFCLNEFYGSDTYRIQCIESVTKGILSVRSLELCRTFEGFRNVVGCFKNGKGLELENN